MKPRAKQMNYWLPLLFYLANMITWIIIALAGKLWDLLWPVSFPLLVVLIYFFKSQRN